MSGPKLSGAQIWRDVEFDLLKALRSVQRILSAVPAPRSFPLCGFSLGQAPPIECSSLTPCRSSIPNYSFRITRRPTTAERNLGDLILRPLFLSYFRGSKRTSTSVSTLTGWPPWTVGVKRNWDHGTLSQSCAPVSSSEIFPSLSMTSLQRVVPPAGAQRGAV